MKIIETRVYKFKELTEDAQDVALQEQCEINVDYEWWESVYEGATEIGLKISSFDIGRAQYCNGDFIDDAEDVANAIIENHGHNCETYKDAEAFLTEYEKFQEKLDDEFLDDYEVEQDIEELESEFLQTLLEDYRIILKNEYEYLTSEEAIRETIIANEYDFTADGKLF